MIGRFWDMLFDYADDMKAKGDEKAYMPAKYKGGKKAFVSALIEEALDNSSFEEVPREEQATI